MGKIIYVGYILKETRVPGYEVDVDVDDDEEVELWINNILILKILHVRLLLNWREENYGKRVSYECYLHYP